MIKNHTSTLKFKLARPNILNETNLDGLDPYAHRALDKIENALLRKAWPSVRAPTVAVGASWQQATTGAKAQRNTALVLDDLRKMLQIRPVRELIEELNKHDGRETLEDIVGDSGNTGLFYKVQDELDEVATAFNQQVVTRREGIVYFLFAYALWVEKLKEPESIARWIVDEEDGGMRVIYGAVVDLAVEDFVNRNVVNVGSPNDFADYVKKQIEKQIEKRRFVFAEGGFENDIRQLVEDYAYDKDQFELIDKIAAQLNLKLTEQERQYLNSYIKNSAFVIDDKNADHFIPIALAQFKNKNITQSASAAGAVALDYSVDYYEEDHDALAVNAENVHAAAQLFYVMTLADELGLIDAADLLITRYLSSGQVDIRNKDTLFHLQQYAFSEEFTDLQNSEVYKRTQSEERWMFYRQVFYLGEGDFMEGAVYNTQFEQAWYNLLTETAQYIQKVEESENPVAFVSRQYVAQAIDDLRYNLSSHCTGMAKVISPIINKELDFVINRFFRDEEIIQQLALHNSKSFWKVPERILQDRDGRAVSIPDFLEKARWGHRVISLVADFTQSMVEDDAKFSDFVSTVQAFIISSSQLERERANQPELVGDPMVTNGASGDDWNF